LDILRLPLGLVNGLRIGALELWFLGTLAAIVLIKVIGHLVRSHRERSAASQGPFLVVPPSRGRAVAPLPIQPIQSWTPPAPPEPQPAATDETSETIRIDTGTDGRIQFLPGRLEVVRGVEAGREFHFLRVPGQNVPEVTVGRSHGAAHRHIQIPEATVSRLHARLCYEDRSWRIINLSVTNPVRINGRELNLPEEAVTLTDGDRIQLGEVELCYRDGRP
jgi:hypothetical protein